MEQNKLQKKRIIEIFFGRTGSGKSYLVRKKIKDFDRVIIIDNMLEYDGTIFTSFEEMLNYHEWSEPDHFTYVCRFTNDIDIEYTFAFAYEIGRVLLVVEEAEQYISPQKKLGMFPYIVKYGRHRDVSIFAVARRPAELSLELRSNVNKIHSFKQTNPADIKTLELNGFKKVGSLNQEKYEFETVEY